MKKNFENIEKYIDGEMNERERKEFELLLSQDEDLMQDYLLSKEVNEAIVETEIMELREIIQSIFKENETKVVTLPKRRRVLYYAAATIAILLAVGGLMKEFVLSGSNGQQLYDKYYTPYEVTVTYRSGDKVIDKLLIDAMQKYEEKDFYSALEIFEEVLQVRQDDMGVKLYAGISYMEQEKYDKAKAYLSSVIENKDNLFVDQAKWYMSMCYIKEEQDNKALQILNELILNESSYKELAKKIVNELN